MVGGSGGEGYYLVYLRIAVTDAVEKGREKGLDHVRDEGCCGVSVRGLSTRYL